jgi:hypothetical protein
MGLADLPEWAKKKPGGDALEAELRTRCEKISIAVGDITDKRFTASKADDRVVVSMYREGQDPEVLGESLFTVTDLEDGEYMIADVGAKSTDRPIFVGPLEETLEIVRKELLGTYLEPWERPEEDPESTLSDEDLERLFNPPTDQPPPPGMN